MTRVFKIIRIVGAADGRPTPHDGRYLAHYDPDTPYGTLRLISTDDVAKAQHFLDAAQLHACYSAISKKQPTRPDGRPNRPITGLTVEFLDLDRAK
jgi:hypothetical protein